MYDIFGVAVLNVSRLAGLPDLPYSSLRTEVVLFQPSRDHYRAVDFVWRESVHRNPSVYEAFLTYCTLVHTFYMPGNTLFIKCNPYKHVSIIQLVCLLI